MLPTTGSSHFMYHWPYVSTDVALDLGTANTYVYVPESRGHDVLGMRASARVEPWRQSTRDPLWSRGDTSEPVARDGTSP